MNYIATNTKDFNVPKDRWIATLSDGTTIFDDIGPPGTVSAWRRLKAYLANASLFITSLRLQAFGQDLLLPASAEGYWYSKRANILVNFMGSNSSGGDIAIGYVAEGHIHISWACQDGTVRHEIRELKENDAGYIPNKV